MSKTHELKTIQPYFDAVKDGIKKFEIRKNDRDYEVGDMLILQEYDTKNGYSGEELYFKVTYILDDRTFVPKGYVCMSIV